MTEKRERNTVLTALDIFDNEVHVFNKRKNVRSVQSEYAEGVMWNQSMR